MHIPQFGFIWWHVSNKISFLPEIVIWSHGPYGQFDSTTLSKTDKKVLILKRTVVYKNIASSKTWFLAQIGHIYKQWTHLYWQIA